MVAEVSETDISNPQPIVLKLPARHLTTACSDSQPLKPETGISHFSEVHSVFSFFLNTRYFARPGLQSFQLGGSIQLDHCQHWPVGRLWPCIIKVKRGSLSVSPSYPSVNLCSSFCNFFFPPYGVPQLSLPSRVPPVSLFIFRSLMAFVQSKRHNIHPSFLCLMFFFPPFQCFIG